MAVQDRPRLLISVHIQVGTLLFHFTDTTSFLLKSVNALLLHMKFCYVPLGQIASQGNSYSKCKDSMLIICVILTSK